MLTPSQIFSLDVKCYAGLNASRRTKMDFKKRLEQERGCDTPFLGFKSVPAIPTDAFIV